MAHPLRELLGEVALRIDEDLLPTLYRYVSVPTPKVRAWLREEELAFVDPLTGVTPSIEDLEQTAQRVLHGARISQAAMAGVAGMAGVASVPPEVLATALGTLRLAQRLAVVYGFDPETDRGQMVLWRALAAGFEVELPEQGKVGLTLTDVRGSLRQAADQVGHTSLSLAKNVVRRSAWMVAGRVGRHLPGVSTAMAALGARQRIKEIGQRMLPVFRRAVAAPPPDVALITDALEL